MYALPDHGLKAVDPDLWAVIRQEDRHQEDHIGLVASENHASPAVLAAQASRLGNRHAAGYPGRRHVGGCEYVDMVEHMALRRLERLFGADEHGWAANVQPHSGAQANAAVFMALTRPGDTVLGLSLLEGSPARHATATMPGRHGRDAVWFGLDEHDEIDYAAMDRLAQRLRPRLVIAGTCWHALRIDFERCARIAHDAGALLLVDISHHAGLIAAGMYPNPIPHADVVTGSTHMSLRGPRGGVILMRPEHATAIDDAVSPGLQAGPLMHQVAAKAVAFREALQPAFRGYQHRVLRHAAIVAETLADRGLRIVGGRTESHLVLVDLRSRGITGPAAQSLLGRANLTVDAAAMPRDPPPPSVARGLRIGTQAITTRGFGDLEVRRVGLLIADLLDAPDDAAVLARARRDVGVLTRDFPVYG